MTQQELKELLHYDPLTGIFTWVDDGSLVCAPICNGYLSITLNKQQFTLHRLAFLYMRGEMPSLVDHKDTNRSNNIWTNLRPATGSQNGYNKTDRRKYSSGVKGVTWNKACRKWKAGLTANGKHIHVGLFPDLIGAELAIRKARIKYHGEFAHHG